MMESVTVSGSRVVSLPKLMVCPSCRQRNDVEEMVTAACLADGTADAVIMLSNESPQLRCGGCAQDIPVKVSVSQRVYRVPAQLSCNCCGALTDLRFSRDGNRVKIMPKWPFMPFLACRRCRIKLVFPVLGQDSWRMTAFNLLHRIKIWKGIRK